MLGELHPTSWFLSRRPSRVGMARRVCNTEGCRGACHCPLRFTTQCLMSSLARRRKSKSRFEAVLGPSSAILEPSGSNLWGCLGQSWNPLGGILGRPLNGPLPKSDQKSSWNDLGSSWAVRIAIWILGIPTRWMDRHGSSPAAQVRWRLLLTKRAHGALLGQSRSSFVAIGPVARRKRIWKIT